MSAGLLDYSCQASTELRRRLFRIETLATTRVRKGGKQEDRVTGNLVWYAVEHPETRPAKEDKMPDPHRHIHVVVFNLTYDKTEREWKAVKFRPIMDLRKYFDRRFNQRLLLRAAEQGDYETVRMLAEWAKQLKQMVQQNGSVDREPYPIELANGQVQTHAEPEVFTSTIHKRTNPGKAETRRPTRSKKVKAAKREYPKFLRDGEELLKIGWSKRERKVYRHKAPKRVVLLVTEALQQAGHHGERFGMDQILPIRDPESDYDVPGYQAYLSLAWLRKEHLVVQHGRQGYSLRSEINLTDAVEECWKLLPKS